jgi:hypothetical protein
LTDCSTDHVGRGAPIDLKRAPVQRFSSDQIEHFVEFVLSPLISVDLPFGERNYKLSTGERFTVPNMIRNMIHSRIIAQYKAYCESTTDGDFSPLKDTVLFSILHQCPAAVRKSLSGLDNTSSDGSAAFEELIVLCDQLLSFGKSSRQGGEMRKDSGIISRCTIRRNCADQERSASIKKLPQAWL